MENSSRDVMGMLFKLERFIRIATYALNEAEEINDDFSIPFNNAKDLSEEIQKINFDGSLLEQKKDLLLCDLSQLEKSYDN